MTNTAHPVETTDKPRTNPARLAMIAIAIIAGIAYPFVQGRFGPVADVIIKGSAVGALALAAVFSRGAGQYWLAAIMGAGAVGDMLLEIPGAMTSGGAAFAVGHAIAIVFYIINRRSNLSMVDMFVAIALIGFGYVMPGLLLPEIDVSGAKVVYSLLLCAMAAAAWISRFPRDWVAAGALLFVVSDTFLIMRMGGLIINTEAVHGHLIWFSYFIGQFMIFTGVSQGLAAAPAKPA